MVCGRHGIGADTQRDRQTDRQTDKQTDRQTDRQTRLTNKQHESPWQNTAEYRDNQSSRCYVLTRKITKHWNAESLKYVVHIEQRRQYLDKVTDNVVPPHSAGIPTPATMHTCFKTTLSSPRLKKFVHH